MPPDGMQLVRQWLLKAQSDLLLAQRATDGDPPLLDGAVYHCQQTAEKALKAFLALHDQPLMRTHNLPELLAACMEIDPDLAILRDAAIMLNPYATQFRYPGDEIAPPHDAVSEALQFASQVLTTINSTMPEDARLPLRTHDG